jgi:hypothetical protein
MEMTEETKKMMKQGAITALMVGVVVFLLSRMD